MIMRLRLWGAAGVLLALVGSAPAAETAGQIDRLLTQEDAGKKIKEAPVVEDLAFLRRVYLDLIGRIPTEAEIKKFLALPAKERRAAVINELSKREQFADVAASCGKTRRQETRVKMRLLGVYLTEVEQTSILWPPEEKPQGKPRKPVQATFPFTMDKSDSPSKHIARFTALRERQVA